MTDPRFFRPIEPLVLGGLAERMGAAITPGGDRDLPMDDVPPLDAAGPRHVSFFDDRKHIDAFAHSEVAARAPRGMALLLRREPYKAYALAAQAFPAEPLRPGIAATTIVDPSALLGAGCQIAATIVIGVPDPYGYVRVPQLGRAAPGRIRRSEMAR